MFLLKFREYPFSDSLLKCETERDMNLAKRDQTCY